MKVIAKATFRIGEGAGEKKKHTEVAPGKEVDLPKEEAADRIARGLAYDPDAEAKAEADAKAEAEAAKKGKPVGGKKPGGEKSG